MMLEKHVGEVFIFDEPSHEFAIEARYRFNDREGQVSQRWESADFEALWVTSLGGAFHWADIVRQAAQYGWSLHVVETGTSGHGN